MTSRVGHTHNRLGQVVESAHLSCIVGIMPHCPETLSMVFSHPPSDTSRSFLIRRMLLRILFAFK